MFRFVEIDVSLATMQPGNSENLETTDCKRVVDGRLPEFIADTARLPADALPAGGRLRISSHLSTPVVLQDSST